MMSEENKQANDAAAEPTGAAAKPTLKSTILGAVRHWWKSGFKGIEQKSSDELAAIRTDLAAARTLMAGDRTMMAWIRTALSMYSFGFTIFKVLQGLQETGKTLPQGYTPQTIGLMLTGLGTLAMVMGTIEYWGTLEEVHKTHDFRLARPALIMALLMSVLGVSLFIYILVELF